MNLRFLWWLLATAPLFTAIGWATFSCGLPESLDARAALGEMVWAPGELGSAAGGPDHVVTRALHLAALEVPGATVRSVIWLNVVCAFLLASTLLTVARRSFPAAADGPGRGLVWVAVIGMLVASPGHGCNWCYGQRVGMFLAPTLLLLGLCWLQGEGRFALRAVAALLVAGVAPLCHTNGLAVVVALVPPLMARCRAGSTVSAMAWLGALLAVGGVATWWALRTAGALGAADVDFLRHVSSAPRELIGRLLTETGHAWMDLLPTTKLDEQAMGLFSWSLPLLLMVPVGRRDAAARLQAAPWWGCLWFGLAVTLLAGFRYELAPPIGTVREVTYGAFLLPVGAIGLLATRFGGGFLPVAAGALLVLGAQDWHIGLEDLRLARMRGVHDMATLFQEDWKPEDSKARAQKLEARSRGSVDWRKAQPEQLFELEDAGRGLVEIELQPRGLRGHVLSSLRNPTAAWLGLVAQVDGGAPELVAEYSPRFERSGRKVWWELEVPESLFGAEAAAARVRIMAFVPEQARVVALGPPYVVKDGSLAAAGSQ